MTGRDEHRAVSEVIGFILIFSFVILAFTIYQGVVVPDQNRVAEFDHNQAVQGQMQDVRNAIMGAALGGAEQTVSVTLDAEYPRRTIARNLGYSGGSLRTTSPSGPDTILIENAKALDRYGETDDFWDGSARSFTTRELVYEPVYARYTGAPITSYENSLAYNRFGDGVNLSITGESLVDGKRITIVSLVGNFSESGDGTVSIDPKAISASTQRISVRNETRPINITLPSRLDAAWWNRTLREEIEDGHVLTVEDAGRNRVSISLATDTTYTLRMAKIGVGTSGRDEGVKYLTLTERPSRTVFNDTSHAITVETRDKFNNPVSGVRVTGTTSSGADPFSESQVATGTDGEATFDYTAPSDPKTDRLRFNVSPEDGSEPADHETVQLNVTVKSSMGGGDSGGGTDDLNPNTGSSVQLLEATTSSNDEWANVTLVNQGERQRNVTGARVTFYYDSGAEIERLEGIYNRSGSDGTMVRAGSGETIPTAHLEFRRDQGRIAADGGTLDIGFAFSGGNDRVREGDFFFFSLTYENGDVATYIAAPRE